MLQWLELKQCGIFDNLTCKNAKNPPSVGRGLVTDKENCGTEQGMEWADMIEPGHCFF